MCNRRWCSSVFGIVATLLAAILLGPSAAEAQDGWTWQNPLPQGNSLNGIWGSGANNVFAVGDEGTIVQYDGIAWSTMPSGLQVPLREVWGSSGTSIFAVGDQGAIVHYDGTSWSIMASGVTDSLRDIWGSSASDVFAVGSTGAILHYNGANWTAMPGSTGEQLAGVWGNSPSDVYAVGRSGAVLHYDGARWSPIPADLSAVVGSITDIWSSSEGTFAVTDDYGNGPVLRYTGTGWIAIGTIGFPAYGIWVSSTTEIFVVEAFGAITFYDGSDWIGVGTGLSSLNGVWGTSSSNVYAVGYGGMILHYDGASWTNISSVTNKGLRDIWGCSGGDVFAVGEDATILRYDGASWAAMPSGANGFLGGVWGSSCNDVFAVGAANGSPSGLILHYDGNNWSAMDSGIPYGLNDIWGDSANNVFAVGSAATILHYDGVTWSVMRSGAAGTESLSAVWGSSAGDVYAVGSSWEGAILHYDGHAWNTVSVNFPMNSLSDVWGSSSSDVYAVGNGVLHYDGEKWDGVSIPTGWPYYDFTAVWGSGSDDVFVAGSAYGWTSNPPANLQKLWHYDGTTWSAMPYPGSVPSAGWANSAIDVFAVGQTSILHYPESSTHPLLRVAKDGSGTGSVTSDPSGIACGPTCSAIFPAGTVVTLTASADAGMLFAGWSGACTGTGPCVVTMDAAKTVTATFTRQIFALSVVKDGSGTGSVMSSLDGIACGPTCSALFPAGTVVPLTASADAGMLFAGWSGACSGTGPCVVTMDAAKTVTATFDVEGSVMPQGSMMYYGGQLETRQHAAASAVPATTYLAVFEGAPPPGLYLVGVEGSAPYLEPNSAFKLVNRLLRTGCNGSACSAVNCAYYSPDGTRTDIVVTEPIATEHVYLPVMTR